MKQMKRWQIKLFMYARAEHVKPTAPLKQEKNHYIITGALVTAFEEYM